MAKIILPKNILKKEEYLVLPPLEKGEYIDNVIKEILALNPSGVSASEVDNAIYFEYTSVWHHLEILASRAECLRIEHGETDIYYMNSVIAHLKEIDVTDGKLDSCYSFDLVENIFGKFIRIQRKMDSRSTVHATHNGLLIPLNFVGDAARLLNKFAKTKNISGT